MTTKLPEAVSAVSPLSDAISGASAAPPALRRRKAADLPTGTYKGWRCPKCEREYPEDDAVRHLIAEVNGLEERIAQLGPKGIRSEPDELGNLLIWGPDDDDRPAVWLKFKDLIVDSSVQRDLRSGHRLLRPDAELDYDKTEALTVVPVHEQVQGADNQFRLIAYRAVEGQHRARLGQKKDPEGYQLCKVLLNVPSRQDEARLGREISHSRSGFAAFDDWRALLREGDPHVVAATRTLDRLGYLISPNNSRHSLIAVSVIFRILGLRKAKGTKTPEEGAGDLEDVIYALEGMQDEDGEGGARFRSTLLAVTYDLIMDNRAVLDLDRLRDRLGSRTAKGWLAFYVPALGGRDNIRAYMALAYNKSLKTTSRKIS